MSLNQQPLSSADLLRAVKQLSGTELDQFVAQVLAVRAQQRAKSVSHTETRLLQRINTPLPDEILMRYRTLIALRREEHLTIEQHSELLHLSDVIEELNNQRIEAVSELAKLRGTTLTQVMDELKIKPLSYE